MAITGGGIVCGVDGSSSGPALVRVAAAVARLLDAPLDLVHVLGAGATAPAASGAAGGPWRTASEAREDEHALLARARAMLDDLARAAGAPDARRHVLAAGEPGRRLAKLAQGAGARMIVAAARQSPSADAALLGSVSGRLAVDAPCPVLILGPGFEHDVDPGNWPGRPVVCGLDGSRLACAAALHAADLCLALGGSLIAVSVDCSPDVGCLERLRRRLTDSPSRLDVDARLGDPAHMIERVANAANAVLIAVGSSGLGPRTDELLGAVCQDLLRAARRPILVVPGTALR